MSLELRAPWPLVKSITRLPNPRLGDSEGSVGSLDVKYAVNGTRYTYVRTKDGRRVLVWQFLLTTHKYQELREFLEVHHSDQIRATDHLGQIWLGYITSNPADFDSDGRRARRADTTNNEMYTIALTFEGTKQ